jgi:actin-related protein
LENNKNVIGKIKDEYLGLYKTEYPIQRGSIKNYEQMEEVWDYVIKTFKKSPKEKNLLIVENSNIPLSETKKMTEVLMEKYNFQGLYFSEPSLLTLYSYGIITGVSVEIGEGVTTIGAYNESWSTKKSINFGGMDMNGYIKKKLIQEGHREDFMSTTDDFIIRKIKERYFEKEYVLPDGKKIKLSKDINNSDEVLFNPSIIGENYPGIFYNKSRYSNNSTRYYRKVWG